MIPLNVKNGNPQVLNNIRVISTMYGNTCPVYFTGLLWTWDNVHWNTSYIVKCPTEVRHCWCLLYRKSECHSNLSSRSGPQSWMFLWVAKKSSKNITCLYISKILVRQDESQREAIGSLFPPCSVHSYAYLQFNWIIFTIITCSTGTCVPQSAARYVIIGTPGLRGNGIFLHTWSWEFIFAI